VGSRTAGRVVVHHSHARLYRRGGRERRAREATLLRQLAHVRTSPWGIGTDGRDANEAGAKPPVRRGGEASARGAHARLGRGRRVVPVLRCRAGPRANKPRDGSAPPGPACRRTTGHRRRVSRDVETAAVGACAGSRPPHAFVHRRSESVRWPAVRCPSALDLATHHCSPGFHT
jgi:hypothetical protein